MTKQIWLISDTHFFHHNIIEYEHRPFANTKEMDEHMTEMWNQTVNPEDKVIHLGDVAFFNKDNLVLPQLNGHKTLLLGNHDHGQNQELQKHFEKIELWKKFPEYGLLLSHVPVHPNELIGFDGTAYSNVHGHIHDKVYSDKRYINVSVERINYTPIAIEEVIRMK